MKRGLPLVPPLAGLLALLAAAIVAGAQATPTTSTSRCASVAAIESVFPKAAIVGFKVRRQIRAQSRRQPFFPGWCGSRWTTYESYPGPSIDVSVTLYRTHRNALAPLSEPLYGPIRTLPNGASVRTLGGVSPGAASVFRNVFVSSTSVDGASVSAQLRIHRRIHAAVLAPR